MLRCHWHRCTEHQLLSLCDLFLHESWKRSSNYTVGSHSLIRLVRGKERPLPDILLPNSVSCFHSIHCAEHLFVFVGFVWWCWWWWWWRQGIFHTGAFHVWPAINPKRSFRVCVCVCVSTIRMHIWLRSSAKTINIECNLSSKVESACTFYADCRLDVDRPAMSRRELCEVRFRSSLRRSRFLDDAFQNMLNGQIRDFRVFSYNRVRVDIVWLFWAVYVLCESEERIELW